MTLGRALPCVVLCSASPSLGGGGAQLGRRVVSFAILPSLSDSLLYVNMNFHKSFDRTLVSS